jgi:hypothetical protein
MPSRLLVCVASAQRYAAAATKGLFGERGRILTPDDFAERNQRLETAKLVEFFVGRFAVGTAPVAERPKHLACAVTQSCYTTQNHRALTR